MSAAGLKLRARDSEDLAVIATVLQDALVLPTDMKFLPAEHRFMLVANRFCWEEGERTGPGAEYERVNCCVVFDGVDSVKHLGLHRASRFSTLSLLTIEVADGAVLLVFAGGGRVRLGISRLDCHMTDLGEPWPTRWRPHHPDAPESPPERGPKGDG